LNYQIVHGDALNILKSLPGNSLDSLVTDPPAGIGLRHLDWDRDKGGRDLWVQWLTEIMSECHRVLKPGAHGFVWALPRTSHWTATALENAGFIVKDIVTHVFGTGFPKNVAIHKSLQEVKYSETESLFLVTEWIRNRRDELGLKNKDLDKAAGVRGGACHWTARRPNGQPHIPTKERWERLETLLGPAPEWLEKLIKPDYGARDQALPNRTETETNWTGWGTALKPATEHWILIQKPMTEHNTVANVLKFRTGAINIDDCRIPVKEKIPSTSNLDFKTGGFLWETSERSRRSFYHQHPLGRHPANFLLTKSPGAQCPVKIINAQNDYGSEASEFFKTFEPEFPFIYCKKAGQGERGLNNDHPTVKPLRLMRYLCRMITPDTGTVLDPFMGSGTTGVAALSEKLGFHGIELNQHYYELSEQRLKGILK
jgi:hypothetical protein